VYDGPVDTESISQFAKEEYGWESSGLAQEVTQPVVEPIVQDDARSRVAALDANSSSDVPMSVNDELVQALKGASVKDSLRAKLTIMDNEKEK